MNTYLVVNDGYEIDIDFALEIQAESETQAAKIWAEDPDIECGDWSLFVMNASKLGSLERCDEGSNEIFNREAVKIDVEKVLSVKVSKN